MTNLTPYSPLLSMLSTEEIECEVADLWTTIEELTAQVARLTEENNDLREAIANG